MGPHCQAHPEEWSCKYLRDHADMSPPSTARPAAVLGLSAVVATYASTRLATAIDAVLLRRIVAGFMIGLAFYFLWRLLPERAATVQHSRTSPRWIPALGVVGDAFSGFFSVGGGACPSGAVRLSAGGGARPGAGYARHGGGAGDLCPRRPCRLGQRHPARAWRHADISWGVARAHGSRDFPRVLPIWRDDIFPVVRTTLCSIRPTQAWHIAAAHHVQEAQA